MDGKINFFKNTFFNNQMILKGGVEDHQQAFLRILLLKLWFYFFRLPISLADYVSELITKISENIYKLSPKHVWQKKCKEFKNLCRWMIIWKHRFHTNLNYVRVALRSLCFGWKPSDWICSNSHSTFHWSSEVHCRFHRVCTQLLYNMGPF